MTDTAETTIDTAYILNKIDRLQDVCIKQWDAIRALERDLKITQATRVTEQAITRPSPESEALWHELRAWRKETATAASKNAYNIFSDKTMAAIVANLPADRYELLAIKGIGQMTVDSYADDILTIVKKHAPW